MGRRKVEIRKLPSQRDRNATYKKRKPGLVKKARELAVLTDSCVHLSILNRDKWEEHRFSVDDLPAAPAASGGDGSAARAPPPTPFQIQEETNGCEGTGALALLSWAPEEPIAPTEDWQAPGASQGMDGTLASLSSWCNGDVGLAPLGERGWMPDALPLFDLGAMELFGGGFGGVHGPANLLHPASELGGILGGFDGRLLGGAQDGDPCGGALRA